ncbi:hypothetical protein [Sinanaerobacter sp. ZZT-01]|uniref:hypothetical protein n=1 Tax=Sinanaerobacter sp. ZZT-01 TaxID=3111540 RepID=UPI002D7659DB|nr:hypothetical protein [Sinanaerobacter sp. ZZT-01]WRR94476.1 hypothetical protein U5921_04990 [Sinanaerobacter sp. ZZT-01]
MKIKTKRILMLLLLFAAVIWNCLCISNILPLHFFTASLAAVGSYSLLITFMPLLFINSAPTRERSAYIHNLTKREKQMSNVTLCLIFIWIVTLVACIV